MGNKTFDVTSVGIMVCDVFGKTIDTFPEPGTSVFFEQMEMHPGGCAYNTGVDLARLGSRVALGGLIGEDAFGDTLLEHMRREKVDCSGVCRTGLKATSFSFVMVPASGNRRIYTSFGANSLYGPEHIDTQTVLGSRILHVGGVSMMDSLDGEPLRRLLSFARDNGVKTCVDPVYRESGREKLEDCLPYLTYFMPNNEESVFITGYTDPMDQLRFYLDKGIETVVVKLGKEGCLFSNGKAAWRMGVQPVEAVDTCGAGDAFIAGFLHGAARGWEVTQCARFATTVAAFCVSAVGTTQAVPPEETVLQYLREHPLSAEEIAL